MVLILQAAFFYGFSRAEKAPYHQPLANFSLANSNWKVSQELEIDKESLAVLNADDILSRAYVNQNNGEMATLFVAYFSTQRTGKAPHSPKNCLPGSGWVASQSGVVDIDISGQTEPIRVNEYVVSRGNNESVVLYWYQSHNRIVASEYSAKIYTVLDSIHYDRSDTALVRVVVNVRNGNRQQALETATSFVKSFFDPLRQFLPV
jgi:EpsI family protein